MTRMPGSQFSIPLIERRQRTSDDTPPWLGMAFILPVDSDGLSEELKRIYPGCATLRQRKHMAAIDFLKTELEAMTKKSPSSLTVQNVHRSCPESPRSCMNAFTNHEQDTSQNQSPTSTSQEGMSMNYDLQRVEEASTKGKSTPTVPVASETAQQFVFSIVDGRTQQPKIKKKMTKEEKAAYRKTRKHGACLRCRRQKSKCNHVINSTKPPAGPHTNERHTRMAPTLNDESHPLSPNERATIPPLQPVIETSITHCNFEHPNKDTASDDRDDLIEGGLRNERPRYVQSQQLEQPPQALYPEPYGAQCSMAAPIAPATNAQLFSPRFQPFSIPQVPVDPASRTSPQVQSPFNGFDQNLFDYLDDQWYLAQGHKQDNVEPG